MANNSLSNSLNSLSGVTPDSIYLDNIRRKVAEEYKFTRNHPSKIIMGTGDGHLETFPPMEEGSPQNPRHPEFGPAGEKGLTGIEIRNPKMTHHDVALEYFHVDPVAHKTREYIKSSLTPDQFEAMRNQFKDYDMSMGMDMHPDDAMNNGVDSLMRGYMGQAPQEANDAMNYSPTQRAMLGSLQNYMKTGTE